MVEEDYEAEDDMVEEDYEAEEDDEAASQPEAAGEDCDAVKDRNELRLDIEGPAAVIVNDVARPGDECDFHMLYTWHRQRIAHVRFNEAWLETKR